MATIDPRFICSSDLELYMADNVSGLPLSGGIVTFYSDVNRTVLKPVYQLTGTPGNYSFAPLNNPCTLSSSGTFQDALGNNIVPYYYPFSGLPEESTGIQELYYVTVVNSGFTPQFVRQSWPPGASNGITPPIVDTIVDNFIPNGQFLAHNDWVSLTEPPFVQYAYGAETVNAQAIAQGGWNFVYTNGTTATFNNSFSQIPASGGWGMNSFPKYVFNFVCTGFNADALTRDLRIQWPDVNKFSAGNPPGTTPYTLFFDAKSNDSNSYTFSLYKIYYFGSAGNGGSPSAPIEELIGTISIGSTGFISHNINNIIFGDNLGTIGANGDDYVALSLRGPTSGWNIAITDFLLSDGNEIFTSFPTMTNDEMLSRGVAGWMPTPDPTGQDLYLPLILTPQGMVFDQSIVGQIVAKPQLAANAVNNELMMNGATFISSEYSSLGIPYSRLADYLVANCAAVSVTNGSTTSTLPAASCPMFGTGNNFVTVYQNVTTNKFDLSFNTANGANAAADQTSGFTHTSADPLYIFTVPGVPTAGQYFSFTVQTGGTKVFNVWFSVDGAGTAPATPTGANIEVELVTGDSVPTAILKIARAVNGYQFMLMDLRGYFLRGLDELATIDPDAATRTLPGISDNANAWTGAHLGSTEAAAVISHTHTPSLGAAGAVAGVGVGAVQATTGAVFTQNLQIANFGGNETRPINKAVNFFIKY